MNAEHARAYNKALDNLNKAKREYRRAKIKIGLCAKGHCMRSKMPHATQCKECASYMSAKQKEYKWRKEEEKEETWQERSVRLAGR